MRVPKNVGNLISALCDLCSTGNSENTHGSAKDLILGLPGARYRKTSYGPCRFGGWKRRRSRLHILNKHTELKFLIDTGADVSVIPLLRNIRKLKTGEKKPELFGPYINTYDQHILKVSLGKRKKFCWKVG